MAVALITGSSGLIGTEASRFFADKGFDIVGIDNDMRSYFFGDDASTLPARNHLLAELPRYTHHDMDIRDRAALDRLFKKYGNNIRAIIHTAAQPSHDWAATEPHTDFSINATGTLELLESTRRHAPDAAFIFTSTNKVYGDNPNRLLLIELSTRWEIDASHPYSEHGIDENMSVDLTTHSLFGVSKLSADALVQEYGRYFGMNTVCFRGGCLTGPDHAGAELHGFLSYMAKCAATGKPYTIFGYKGKQVRDNIHSYDLVNMFWHYFKHPRPGEVYNAGGGRHSNCSLVEARSLIEKKLGKSLTADYTDDNRIGDHVWYISDTRKFRTHYRDWDYTYDIERIVDDILDALA
jgi:CDP-paratose 2-epimerase